MAKVFRFPPLISIKEILELYQLKALKKLSQNFLLEKRLIDKIVNASGCLKDCEVCEIGPGPGGITQSILKQEPKKLIVIEKDTRFEPILSALKEAVGNKLTVVYADILNFNLGNLFDNSLRKDWDDSPPNIHIIGNLPFHVADVLLFQYLKEISTRSSAWSYGRVPLTLTFQDEVAQRITAEVLSKMRSRVSVMCQNWCNVSYKFSIPGRSFLPKVEVNVGVVRLVPLIQPVIDMDFELVEKVVRVIFNCRQKYLSNTVKKLFPVALKASLTEEFFKITDLSPNTRSFELDLLEWKRICIAYKHFCDRYPGLYNYKFNGPKLTREKDWSACVEASN